MTNLDAASKQWASRPGDQRYLSIQDLHEAVYTRHQHSSEAVLSLVALGSGLVALDDRDLVIQSGQGSQAELTNYSFGQLSTRAGAPAGYLRSLPAQLAAVNLEWGLARSDIQEKTKALMIPPNGERGLFRAFTSETYGRIWDDQVTQALVELDVVTGGVWKVPAATYATTNPKRATTLYASDRDVWAFLVDPDHPIEVPGDKGPRFRGFMVWNSEVGDATFGLRTFLYEYVCDNRIVWGAENVSELKIRHTSGGPARFAVSAAPSLREYAESSTEAVVDGIKRARAFQLPEARKPEDVTTWLRSRGFGKEESQAAVTLAEAEEGDPTNLWNVVQGLTAYARRIEHTDQRVALERKAGALLDLAIR